VFEKLFGHIYDYANPRQAAADHFTKMMREICEYMGRTYMYGADTKMALETLTEPMYEEPMAPPANASQTQVFLDKQVNEHVKRGNMLVENLKLAYLLIYGQCSNTLQAKLELRPNHLAIKGAADSIGLLENVRTVMFQFLLQRYSPVTHTA
jgi:hypothetical protein